jgi:hypothetical protein
MLCQHLNTGWRYPDSILKRSAFFWNAYVHNSPRCYVGATRAPSHTLGFDVE